MSQCGFLSVSSTNCMGSKIMPMFRVTTVETATYVYYMEAENADAIVEECDYFVGGKEIHHEFEIIDITEEKKNV